MVCCNLFNINMSTKMQVDTFIFLLFCCLFGVYIMRLIYMVIVKEILFTCVIYAVNLYHRSERDIPNFCMTLVLIWFGKGDTHMVSIYWSDSNAYFPYLRQIINSFVLNKPV